MKTFLGNTKESVGVLPAIGAKCIIEEIERSATGENAKTPGALMYNLSLRVVEPTRFAGANLRDWFVIGTEDDKRGKKAATWERSEGGPGKLQRVLKRAGVPASDDDEEWMEAAADQEICIHIGTRPDRETGETRNRVVQYFRESDGDFIGIGEELEAPSANGKGGRKKATAAAGAGNARKKAKPAEDDDEEPAEEDEAPKAKKKGKAEPEEDEADEEEAPAKARGRKAKAKDPDDDDDED